MKTLMLVSALILGTSDKALAADVGMVDAPVVSGVYDWSGFYVGIDAGYGIGTSGYEIHQSPDGLLLFSGPEPDGFLLGAHAGYNWHFGNGFVVGGEADLNYSASNGGDAMYQMTPTGAFPHSSYTMETEVKWTGSARARLGYAIDRLLPYVAAGVAAAGVESDFNIAGYPANPYHAYKDTYIGWTGGIGAEYALTDKVSIRAEYRYADYGSQDFATPGISNSVATIDLQSHDVRFGLSYRF